MLGQWDPYCFECVCAVKYAKWIINNNSNNNYSMEQSPFWESNRFSASQEIPCILQNLKVHCHIHTSPSLVPILSQINPVYTPLPNLTFCGPYIVIYLHNKNQKDALFYSQFILIINLYKFWAGLMLIVRYFSVELVPPWSC